jgi:putative oxidoreductase
VKRTKSNNESMVMNTRLANYVIRRQSITLRDFSIDLISRSPIARWAPVPLRLIVGYGFMEHGFAKLARGPDAFPAILQALGVPAPHLMGWLTILVEIAGGLAVLLGALVRLASIPMAAVLLVAIFTAHLPYGFSSIKLQAVTAAGAQFGPPALKPICSTSPAWRRSSWGARDRYRSRAFSQSAEERRVRRRPLAPSASRRGAEGANRARGTRADGIHRHFPDGMLHLPSGGVDT